jgi:hypothetical protein
LVKTCTTKQLKDVHNNKRGGTYACLFFIGVKRGRMLRWERVSQIKRVNAAVRRGDRNWINCCECKGGTPTLACKGGIPTLAKN